jgi:hypothetical protein
MIRALDAARKGELLEIFSFSSSFISIHRGAAAAEEPP